MRRSRSFRVFAALFAPWFALVVAEPVPMHDCPMHSMHAMHSMHSMQSTAGSSTAGHANPERSDAGIQPAGAAPRPDAPAGTAHHQCCCLDSCCAAALMALSRAPTLEWVPAELRRDVPRTPAVPFAAATAEHVLPFANGPPTALA